MYTILTAFPGPNRCVYAGGQLSYDNLIMLMRHPASPHREATAIVKRRKPLEILRGFSFWISFSKRVFIFR